MCAKHKKYRIRLELENEVLKDAELLNLIRLQSHDKAKDEAPGFDFHSMTFSRSEFPYHDDRFTVIFEYRYFI